jgi:hypothetical protein
MAGKNSACATTLMAQETVQDTAPESNKNRVASWRQAEIPALKAPALLQIDL